jgi:hypothetical protein
MIGCCLCFFIFWAEGMQALNVRPICEGWIGPHERRVMRLRVHPLERATDWVREQMTGEKQGASPMFPQERPWQPLELRKPPHRDPSCFRVYFEAENKRLRLWEAILRKRSRIAVAEELRLGDQIKVLSPEYVQGIGKNAGEFRSQEEKRFTHRRGVVALVRLERKKFSDCPFTGIFEGDIPGILRASDVGFHGGFSAAVAIRCFVGHIAQNVSLLALDSWDVAKNVDEEEDFFASVLTSELPCPKEALAKMRYHAGRHALNLKSSESITRLDFKKASSWTVQGERVAAPTAPLKLVLEPSQDLASKSAQDFRDQLFSLSPGISLYEIFLYGSSESEVWHWGSLYLESPFVASSLGDKLVFKHEFGGEEP